MEVESSRSAETSLGAFLSKISRSSSWDSMAEKCADAGFLASGKRLQIAGQIVNALFAEMMFDKGMNGAVNNWFAFRLALAGARVFTLSNNQSARNYDY